MLNQHKTTKSTIETYNKLNPLVEYLVPLIGDKKSVKIADIGSGPFSTIGRYLEGVNIGVYPSDSQDFTAFYKKHHVDPLFPIEYQNMEKLLYPNESFDIVHCTNALDHTFNADRAVEEMIRVCKTGGWVYIDCNLDQLDTGGKHYWNVKEDGRFENFYESFDLKDFGFTISFRDGGGERRYSRIVALLKKQ